MQTIDGVYLEKFPSIGLEKVSDLIYFDGPLLSYCKTAKEDHYLTLWVDKDTCFNRWLVVRISPYRINAYIHETLSLYDIITDPNDGFLYKIDIDAKLNYCNIQLIYPERIPASYLPGKDSFYSVKSHMQKLLENMD